MAGGCLHYILSIGRDEILPRLIRRGICEDDPDYDVTYCWECSLPGYGDLFVHCSPSTTQVIAVDIPSWGWDRSPNLDRKSLLEETLRRTWPLAHISWMTEGAFEGFISEQGGDGANWLNKHDAHALAASFILRAARENEDEIFPELPEKERAPAVEQQREHWRKLGALFYSGGFVKE